ncbi:MAG: outer membrane lipoprotein chaperone LolA [Rhodoferax sp.]|nr:outer membrane lipoprotein chaperone LolA [Rhodoferax sp.]
MRQIAILLIAISAVPVWAAGLKSLESFISGTKTGRAAFTQVVTFPARDGQAARSKTSSGSFEFARPSRFKFIYQKPFEQSIVADGQTLWLYDLDLNQVTARKQASALGSTPAALIASAASLQALEADFVLTEAPSQDGLAWAVATPKGRDLQLQSVRVGFRGAALEKLEILDSFGQKSVLTFSGFQANLVLNAAAFEFKPPATADLIRQ